MAEFRLGEVDTAYQRAIDEELVRWLGPQLQRPDGFYDMMRYQFGLVDYDLSHPRQTDERSIEPLLCLLACQAVGEHWRAAVRAAAAIELLAGWFQIHRDIEVHDPMVQGRSTLWARWGEPQAINSGDGLFPIAGLAILEAGSDAEISLALARELAQTAVTYMEGQYIDLTSAKRHDVTAEDYLTTLNLRVGALFGYSVWAGAMIAGAGEDARRELRSFGSELGLAWHIRHQVAARSRSNGTAMDSDQNQKELFPVLLTEIDARQHADLALAALQRAHLETAGLQQLEAFARELVLG